MEYGSWKILEEKHNKQENRQYDLKHAFLGLPELNLY